MFLRVLFFLASFMSQFCSTEALQSFYMFFYLDIIFLGFVQQKLWTTIILLFFLSLEKCLILREFLLVQNSCYTKRGWVLRFNFFWTLQLLKLKLQGRNDRSIMFVYLMIGLVVSPIFCERSDMDILANIRQILAQIVLLSWIVYLFVADPAVYFGGFQINRCKLVSNGLSC